MTTLSKKKKKKMIWFQTSNIADGPVWCENIFVTFEKEKPKHRFSLETKRNKTNS